MTIQHPITGEQITPGGIVGNIYPGGPDGYMIRVQGIGSFNLSDAGKWVCVAGGEQQGDVFANEVEAQAEADAWREAYPDAEVEVFQLVESWGTRSY